MLLILRSVGELPMRNGTVSGTSTISSTSSAVLDQALRHDRLVVSAALVSIASLAWWYLLNGAGMGMSAADMTRMIYGDHSVMSPGLLMAPAIWTPRYAVLMFLMWWIMMIAMMLPSAASVVLLAAAINRGNAPESPPFGRTQGFLLGYLLSWAAFSVLATIAQWILQQLGLLSAMTLHIPDKRVGGVLLVLAAIWQITPYKHACLARCRSPAARLVAGRGRPALLAGLGHGTYCVGCCWMLMGLLFAGGVMNLFWIAGLGALVLAEKLLPQGLAVVYLVAGALVLTGIFMIVC
ncbi:MAG: DUF2182 domain-containing protein [Gammaproteobacteria bacterium]|nr:DUF2182 domain-containing protein [Gammaproteobacteria bacterium]